MGPHYGPKAEAFAGMAMAALIGFIVSAGVTGHFVGPRHGGLAILGGIVGAAIVLWLLRKK